MILENGTLNGVDLRIIYVRRWYAYIMQMYIGQWLDAFDMAVFADLDERLFSSDSLLVRTQAGII